MATKIKQLTLGQRWFKAYLDKTIEGNNKQIKYFQERLAQLDKKNAKCLGLIAKMQDSVK